MTDTDNLTRRRFLKATGGAASAAAIAGCTGDNNEDSNDDNDDNEQGDNRLQLINSTMTTLDPVKSTGTASGTVIQQVFDPLFNYPNAEVNVENLVAKGHEVSDDLTTYTFELKEGVKFHGDYGEVTAEDVVYSWRRLAESKNSRRARFILSILKVKHESTTKTYKDSEGEEHELSVAKPDTISVEAVDDYTVKMTMEQPFHATLEMLAYTSFAVLPKGIVGDIEGYDGEMSHKEFATKKAIGCGPFEFNNWSSNNKAKVEAFDDYHGTAPSVDGITWNIMSDANARHTFAFKNNNVDFAYSADMPTSKYDPKAVKNTSKDDLGRTVGEYEAEGETMDYLEVMPINTYYMGFNMDAIPKPVRQAVAYAMNQDSLVKEVFKERGTPAYHFTPPAIYPGGAPKYEEHAKNKYPYGYNESNLEKAQKLIEEETDYGPNNKFEFTFTVYKSSTAWPKVAKLLRDKLASAHININVEKTPFSTLTQRGRNGKLEAYSLGWIMDYPRPDNFLNLLYPPESSTDLSAPLSYMNWEGTDAAESAKNAWETVSNNTQPTDEAQQTRNDAYVTMEEANWEDVGQLPVYHGLEERYTYDHVEAPKFGGGGYSRQMYNEVKLDK
ncbi:ABC transporter substrate-binding protein [Halomicrococcus gelatinilyticus]|uniref:ABC transporter substrate-binding protein n=1 Tax=Halomicrococcus gelatinilyticus TaxID=1702103 RepID=UPI002E0E6948